MRSGNDFAGAGDSARAAVRGDANTTTRQRQRSEYMMDLIRVEDDLPAKPQSPWKSGLAFDNQRRDGDAERVADGAVEFRLAVGDFAVGGDAGGAGDE